VPYKIRWIKQGPDTLVTERSRFTFSIRKHYSDSILCDVVEMNACHLILGRPWQYDVDAQHKGRDNIYIVFQEGRKIIFRPLKGDPVKDPTPTKTQSVLLTKGDGFLKRKFSWGNIAERSFNSRSSYFQEGETDVGQFHSSISPKRTLLTRASSLGFSPGHTLFSDTIHLSTIHLRTVHPSTIHPSTVHPSTVHSRTARRIVPLSRPFDLSMTYTQTTIFQSMKSYENPKHLRLLIHLLTKGEM
jgi:hypothetical protein